MMDIYTEKCSKGKYFQEKYKEVTSKKVKSFNTICIESEKNVYSYSLIIACLKLGIIDEII